MYGLITHQHLPRSDIDDAIVISDTIIDLLLTYRSNRNILYRSPSYKYTYVIMIIIVITYMHLHKRCSHNNNNNNNHDDIYSAVNLRRQPYASSLWFIWAKVGQRQVAANS